MESVFLEAPEERTIPICMTKNISETYSVTESYFVRVRDLKDKRSYELDRNGLLERPISVLLSEIEEEDAIQQAIRENNRDNMTLEPTCSSQLWTDKYKPKSFLDLITDEYINREALG